MKKNQGFTLIELLVVIAIIGILSSVVLASLNTARAKGADAAIKSNLGNMRAQGELIFTDKGCYSSDGAVACAATAVTAGVCPTTAGTIFGNANVQAAITATIGQGVLAACSSSANQATWAIVAGLKSSSTKAWCVDNTGKSKEVTVADGGQTAITAEINAAGNCVE
ncbi:MAG: type II secretion system protein [Candidatus Pacebacteria bacterium]|nr:type II secretion system protein [Candidatus Paceibacterota bacterium]